MRWKDLRKIIPVLMLLFLVSQVSAVSGEIREKGCKTGEVAAFSMYSKTGGNVAEPGYFKWDVCMTEVKDINLRTSCKDGEGNLISMYSKKDSHASVFTSYKWNVCTDRVRTTVKQSCSNSIASLQSKDDSHAAKPDYFKWQLCPEFLSPDNVSIEMKGVSGTVYADDNTVSTGDELLPPVEYPYIVSDRPAGIVGYGEFVSLSYPSSDTVEMTQKAGSSFLLPFTSGGYQEVEDKEDEVNSREFLDQLEPSFSFEVPDQPTVKVFYEFSQKVEGFDNRQNGFVELALRNKFTDSNRTELLIRPP